MYGREVNIYKDTGLGIAPAIVATIIATVAQLVPVIINLTKGKKDQWSSMHYAQKEAFVRQGLIVATVGVLQGKAYNVEDIMRTLIAQVELDESWDEWKRLNPDFYGMIQDAQKEVEEAKKGNTSYNYEFIPPDILQQYFLQYSKTHKTASMLNLNSYKMWITIVSFSLLGYAFYKRNKKKEIRRIENVENR